MGDWAPTVGIVGLALVVGTTLVLSGPVGKALGEWIRGWSKEGQQWMALEAAKHGAVLPGDTARVLEEVEELKRRLAEMEERLDFTERLLAKERVADRLGPPR
jgi:hypothetical protein